MLKDRITEGLYHVGPVEEMGKPVVAYRVVGPDGTTIGVAGSVNAIKDKLNEFKALGYSIEPLSANGKNGNGNGRH